MVAKGFTEVIISNSGRLHTLLFVPAKRFVLLTAIVETVVVFKPVFTGLQLAPLFVERETLLLANTKTFGPLTAVADAYVRLVLTTLQLVPLFVERKMPPLVPAKRFVPLTASVET